MSLQKTAETIVSGQEKWWIKQGLQSPVVSVEDFEKGIGRVPDVVGEFGFFPSSVLVLTRPKALFDYLADVGRPQRHVANAYHTPIGASIFPPAASWFCIKYWSKKGDVVLDPFGNRANIGLVANWLGRRVILNDIAPSYCRMMEAAGDRRVNQDLPWTVFNRDAADLSEIPDSSVDLILTGPPYHNVEPYEKVPGQASSFRTYAQFLAWYGRVAVELRRMIKPEGFCVYKVGDWRVKGRIVPFTYDTQAVFAEAGWILHDVLICVEPAPLGGGWSWASKWRSRYVSKAHQTVLVWRRGQ